MNESAQVHYLEIVTPDVDKLCTSYSQTLEVSFSNPIVELGEARIAALSNGGLLGVRCPMHTAEQPTTRPYYLVDDIEKAVVEAQSIGAEIAVPPMEIPGRGKCAVIMFGANQSGFWEL